MTRDNAVENDLKSMAAIVQSMMSDCGRKRSLAGQIREAIEEIESAQRNGFSLRVITSELNQHEIKITETYLKNALKRIRADRRDKLSKEISLQSSVLRPSNSVISTKDFKRNTDRTPSELF